MKYITSAFAFALMVAGIATSTPASAMQLCSGCVAAYEKCVAAGGSTASCWKCNNPTCTPFGVKDSLGSAIDKLSSKKSRQMNPMDKRTAPTLLDS